MMSLLLSVLIAAAAPSTNWSNQLPTYHAQALPSFLGITMGEKADVVAAAYGTPDLVKNTDLGEMRVYHIAHGAATLMVLVHDGVIMLVGATLRPSKSADIGDRYGVKLGAPASTIQILRGTPIATLQDGALEYNAAPAGHWFYRAEGGKVVNISLTISSEALGLTKADDTGRDGSSIAHAVVITAATETDGITAEHDYIAKIPCANGGAWLWKQQAALSSGGKMYDRIDVKCSSSDDVRSFFFDITSFYGKLGG
jgi:hypothetical protein